MWITHYRTFNSFSCSLYRPLSIGGSFSIGVALDCMEGCPREGEEFTGEVDEVRYNDT